MEEKQEYLCCHHFVHYLLVAQMRNEGSRRDTDSFVVSLECFAELNNKSSEQQFSDLRQFGIDNSCHSGVDGRER